MITNKYSASRLLNIKSTGYFPKRYNVKFGIYVLCDIVFDLSKLDILVDDELLQKDAVNLLTSFMILNAWQNIDICEYTGNMLQQMIQNLSDQFREEADSNVAYIWALHRIILLCRFNGLQYYIIHLAILLGAKKLVNTITNTLWNNTHTKHVFGWRSVPLDHLNVFLPNELVVNINRCVDDILARKENSPDMTYAFLHTFSRLDKLHSLVIEKRMKEFKHNFNIETLHNVWLYQKGFLTNLPRHVQTSLNKAFEGDRNLDKCGLCSRYKRDLNKSCYIHPKSEKLILVLTENQPVSQIEIKDFVSPLEETEKCPICLDRESKVSISCGHKYCMKCLSEDIVFEKCSICRQSFTDFKKL